MADTQTKPSWSTYELLDAQRRKRKLKTTTAGMTGRIKEVREDGVVVMALEGFAGTAYLQPSSIATQPPSAFQPGDRVFTVFGKARVREVRQALERVDVEVDLLDCPMACNGVVGGSGKGLPGECAVGYFSPELVTRRAVDDRTFAEMIEDAETFRTNGNDFFKSKDYESALTNYRKVMDVFFHIPQNLTAGQKDAAREGIVKAMSNAAQCHVSRATAANDASSEADYRMAVGSATQAMELDPTDKCKQREKLLYRRGLALAGLGDWDAAAVDLADPILAGNDSARAKLAQVKEAARKEREKNKKMWSGAFKKAAEKPSTEETAGADAAQPDGTPAAEAGRPGSAASTPQRPGVRFAGTPDRSAPSSAVKGSGAGASPDQADSPGDASGGRRTKNAGRTPFVVRSNPGEDEEDEDDNAAAAAGGEGTIEVEAEAEEEAGGWLTPTTMALGGIALAGLGYVAYRALRR